MGHQLKYDFQKSIAFIAGTSTDTGQATALDFGKSNAQIVDGGRVAQ